MSWVPLHAAAAQHAVLFLLLLLAANHASPMALLAVWHWQ
jgi:hypothetical protein